MFRQVSLERHQPIYALAQAVDAVVLAACDDDQPARRHAPDRLGDAQLILAAMPAGQHQGDVEGRTFRPRRDHVA